MNKCRIQESDLRAACLYIIFEDWYDIVLLCFLIDIQGRLKHMFRRPLCVWKSDGKLAEKLGPAWLVHKKKRMP